MELTQAQRTALAADIQVNRALIAAGDTAGAADFYNAVASPDYWVWNPAVETKAIMDAIMWQNLTPTVNGDGTVPATIDWANRSLACQGKQFNIQTMLAGRESIDATRTNIRAGLQDALSNVPAGASGAVVSAGWANVKIAMTRKATRIEKLFATGNGSVATPSLMSYVGPTSYLDFSGIV